MTRWNAALAMQTLHIYHLCSNAPCMESLNAVYMYAVVLFKSYTRAASKTGNRFWPDGSSVKRSVIRVSPYSMERQSGNHFFLKQLSILLYCSRWNQRGRIFADEAQFSERHFFFQFCMTFPKKWNNLPSLLILIPFIEKKNHFFSEIWFFSIKSGMVDRLITGG